MRNIKCTEGSGAWGGAIHSEGAITATNSLFENCEALEGAVLDIKTQQDKPLTAKFSKCTFQNNTSTGYGGAIQLNSVLTGEFVFDQCYFSNNVGSEGGAMMIRGINGGNIDMSITNCSFINNVTPMEGNNYGGALAFRIDNLRSPSEFNLNVSNNTFSGNKANHPHGKCICMLDFGTSMATAKGKWQFVNNTFAQNVTEADYESVIWMRGQPGFDMIYMNNIHLDGVEGKPSLTIEESANEKFKSVYVKGNIIDGIGGTSDMPFRDAILDATANFVNENATLDYTAKATLFGIDDLIIKEKNNNNMATTPVAYFPLISGAKAYDFGESEYLVNGKNVVPELDILGNGIYGSSKDAGSFESQEMLATNIERISTEESKTYAFIDQVTNTLVVSPNIKTITIYNTQGAACLSATDLTKISIANLPSGLYVVKSITDEGTIFSQKVKR